MHLPALANRTRVATLSLFCTAILAACGGGGSGDPATGAIVVPACPAATPASFAQATRLGNSTYKASVATTTAPTTRLIARLRADAAGQAGKAAAPAVGGLQLRELIRFDTPVAAKATLAAAQAAPPLRMATYDITDPALTLEAAMQRLRDSGAVDYVEPDVQMRKNALPNDPYFGAAWYLKNCGQYGFASGNDVGAEAAWNRGVGTGSTVVAVVDDGISYSHPDLAPNMWRNPREVVNGVDDDANGVVDDIYGADVVLTSGNVLPYNPRVDSDHGTMVAGIIGARGNNSVGSSGVLWNTQLMALKIEGPPDSNYSLFVSDFVKALNYVVAQKIAGVNVRVVNISYGGVTAVQAYQDAINAAGAQGILVVVAAGNDGSSSIVDLGYPSAWQLANVLSVGAVDPLGNRPVYTNFGSLVNLYAPGEEILTTSMFPYDINDGSFFLPNYRVVSGTSFAAPVVAGAAALLMDTYPASSMAAVRARMLASGTPFGVPAPGVTQVKLNLGAAMATAP